jgi:hypothetical protein
MRLLFVAFAISFCALVWVAIAVARHIRRHEPHPAGSADAPVMEQEATPPGSHRS